MSSISFFAGSGCGSFTEDTGTPSDPWDPGPRPPSLGYGSGSGSGSGSGGMPSPPPMCDDNLRLCPHEFIYEGQSGMPSKGDERLVELRGDYRSNAWNVGDAMSFDGKAWKVTVQVPWQVKTLYKFHIIESDGTEIWIADPGNPEGEPDGFGGTNSVLAGVTCDPYACATPVPTCTNPLSGTGYDWSDTVLYFVFVDRFFNGNPGNDNPSTASGLDPSANWQGGDWAGVTQKIQSGYFNQLGVNALWITVPMGQTDNVGQGQNGDTHIYTAYHGYWPRDLDKPEPRFGTATEWQDLINAAHTAGLKVLIDYEMNHVHQDSSIWQNHMTDGWFNPLTLSGGQQCICGSSVCPWDGPTGITCWFTNYLPDFNYNNADARNFSVQNALTWIENSGADGFRLDAIKNIETTWLTDLRSRLTSEVEPTTKQHVYLVGETFTGDRNQILSYVNPCTMLDGQFDFPLRVQIVTNILLRQGQMQDLRSFMDSNDGFYGTGLMSTFVGNQDMPRSIHFAQNTPLWTDPWADGKDRNFDPNRPPLVPETEAYERFALALSLLYTSHGVPLLYYGDEIGMPGAGDPDNRRFMNWDSTSYNSGQQLLLSRVKQLGAIRKAHAGLRHGVRTTLSITTDTWAYQMSDGKDAVFVLLNRSDSDQMVSGLPSGSFTDQLLGDTVSGPTVTVPARTARILTAP